MGINGEKILVFGHETREMFRNWTNEWKTKTGKTSCAWCKRLWRAFDAVPAGNSRASSGFSACHIIPLSGCIHRKAINRNKPFPGRNRILSVNSSGAKPKRLSRSKAEQVANSSCYHWTVYFCLYRGQRYHLSAKLLCTTIQFCRMPLLIYRQLLLQTPKIVEKFFMASNLG